ncbi:hypothetical protein [Nonomuraea turkmeniaca]|uniref:hypothetical protein n=1 Tax=Nonomuraea turkmeniaca TaxID=103838 RepID=UPI001B87D9F5|nr:hypothetical protein [Nonomuraea turkmeniaca]
MIVPLRFDGLTRSFTFVRDGDHFAGLDPVMCGFIPIQGAGAHHEQMAALAGGTVNLLIDAGPALDVAALFAFFAGMAESEREYVPEKSLEGQAAARERGRLKGRTRGPVLVTHGRPGPRHWVGSLRISPLGAEPIGRDRCESADADGQVPAQEAGESAALRQALP